MYADRVPPLSYRHTLSGHKDRKGSFTTCPTDKVPGYNKCRLTNLCSLFLSLETLTAAWSVA